MQSWYSKENNVRYPQGGESKSVLSAEGGRKVRDATKKALYHETKSASDSDSSTMEKVSTGRKKQVSDALKEAGAD